MAGSVSDGTEDSDSSAEREQIHSSESDGNIPKRQRLTRASTRLSQSSQGSSAQLNKSIRCSQTSHFSKKIKSFPPDTPDLKRAAEHDESPPLTPTGNAPSSESELDISSPNASHDESHTKDQAGRDSDKDLSHRPKRRRCHETYNFNMKCPTPGCNSLGKTWIFFSGDLHVLYINSFCVSRSFNRETRTPFCGIRVSSLSQSVCRRVQGEENNNPDPV